jgi:hypothetical protein
MTASLLQYIFYEVVKFFLQAGVVSALNGTWCGRQSANSTIVSSYKFFANYRFLPVQLPPETPMSAVEKLCLSQDD